MTQRPTFSELKRVLFTLGTVMAVQLKPAAAAAAGEDASEGTGTDSSKQQPSKQAPPGSSQTGVVAAPQPPGEGGEGEALVVVPPGGSPGPKKQVRHVQPSAENARAWVPDTSANHTSSCRRQGYLIGSSRRLDAVATPVAAVRGTFNRSSGHTSCHVV
jgi:hypothetical protein